MGGVVLHGAAWNHSTLELCGWHCRILWGEGVCAAFYDSSLSALFVGWSEMCPGLCLHCCVDACLVCVAATPATSACCPADRGPTSYLSFEQLSCCMYCGAALTGGPHTPDDPPPVICPALCMVLLAPFVGLLLLLC